MTCFPPETSFSSSGLTSYVRLLHELSKKSGLLVRCMHRDKAQDSQLVFDDSMGHVVWFSLPGSPPHGVIYLLKFLHRLNKKLVAEPIFFIWSAASFALPCASCKPVMGPPFLCLTSPSPKLCYHFLAHVPLAPGLKNLFCTN